MSHRLPAAVFLALVGIVRRRTRRRLAHLPRVPDSPANEVVSDSFRGQFLPATLPGVSSKGCPGQWVEVDATVLND